MQNAGLRLWEAQKRQGTGLCVGLDPHLDPNSELNEKFYQEFGAWPNAIELNTFFIKFLDALRSEYVQPMPYGAERYQAADFLAGLTSYFLKVIDAAWEEGVRVYKPQIAFFERLAPYGMLVLEILSTHLHTLAGQQKEPLFLILDAKRGDIDSTQAPYYEAYLSDLGERSAPGIRGRFGFDVMTVNTWMGDDVLSPGLPYFSQGKGVAVVTRTSNPSGTSLQDLIVFPNKLIGLTEGQKHFSLTFNDHEFLFELCQGVPTAQDVMLYLTEKFSKGHGLDYAGVSPLLSVVGSTVKLTKAFRSIRPGGVALVPGFGAQGGKFENVMPLLVTEGALAGHLGILSSSREHNFPWMVKAGGNGKPENLRSEMARAIGEFRNIEKEAYNKAGATYPF